MTLVAAAGSEGADVGGALGAGVGAGAVGPLVHPATTTTPPAAAVRRNARRVELSR
jgi:hypothetical protein